MQAMTPTDDKPSSSTKYAEFFRQHVHAVHASASRRVGVHDADDVTSQVFAIAWQKSAHEFEFERARAWLLVTVAHVCQNVVRFTARADRKVLMWANDRSINEVNEVSGPEPLLPEHDPVFTEAWNMLKGPDQEVLALVYWDELSYPNAAEALGIAEGALRTRLSRARGRFKELLERAENTHSATQSPQNHTFVSEGKP